MSIKQEVEAVKGKLWNLDPREWVVTELSSTVKTVADYPTLVDAMPDIVERAGGYVTPLEFMNTAIVLAGGKQQDVPQQLSEGVLNLICQQLESLLEEQPIRDSDKGNMNILHLAIREFTRQDIGKYLEFRQTLSAR